MCAISRKMPGFLHKNQIAKSLSRWGAWRRQKCAAFSSAKIESDGSTHLYMRLAGLRFALLGLRADGVMKLIKTLQVEWFGDFPLSLRSAPCRWNQHLNLRLIELSEPLAAGLKLHCGAIFMHVRFLSCWETPGICAKNSQYLMEKNLWCPASWHDWQPLQVKEVVITMGTKNEKIGPYTSWRVCENTLTFCTLAIILLGYKNCFKNCCE